jgi:alkanesulfonate monooxygenase SsuD/methylene tetrahydromethanopterin reductase-like flavin-dependent oxidoreductase (luciferase family)
MLGRVAIAGSADDVVRGVNEFVRAGARHLVFAPATRTRGAEVVERIATDVLPRVATSLRS